jgi:putative tryptophan/tyrosine transport system substrate-binding protein
MIRRRELITLLGGAAVAWPLAARAQQPERIRRIGILMGTAENDPDQQAVVSTFTQALTGLGWRPGGNIQIEYRWASGDSDRLRTQAAELTRLAPDVIFAQGTPATKALQEVGRATPVVFVNVTDPVAGGLTRSLARPDGNLTGFSNYEYSMGSKWLEMLKELAPSVTNVMVILNPDNPALPGQFRSIETAAAKLAVQVSALPVRSAADLERVMHSIGPGADRGVIVLLDFITLAHRELIASLASRHRLPAIYALRIFAVSGGLMSYGVDATDLFRRAASYVDRILKGAKPADLPIQQPTKFELVINLKAAKALGLEVPLRLQQLADEVIE